MTNINCCDKIEELKTINNYKDCARKNRTKIFKRIGQSESEKSEVPLKDCARKNQANFNSDVRRVRT